MKNIELLGPKGFQNGAEFDATKSMLKPGIENIMKIIKHHVLLECLDMQVHYDFKLFEGFVG